jgi:hypothetical protein
MPTDTTPFDLNAKRRQLADLRKQARDLETQIIAHVRKRLTAVFHEIAMVRDCESFLAEVRQFEDER